jgi:hypothetical protein
VREWGWVVEGCEELVRESEKWRGVREWEEC